MPAARPRRSTSTSAFGVGKREAHDASGFYGRFTPPALSDDDEVHGALELAEPLVVGDSRDLAHLPDRSVALVVTSPPYFAGKAYEQALGEGGIPADYLEYLQMLRDVFAECVRVLEPGGRIAVNVANLGRKPYRSLSADVTTILQDDLGLLLRGEVLWVKAEGAGGSCAWGSFRSAANPVLRDLSERVVIASKGRFDRARPPARRRKEGLPWRSTSGADEFLEATLDVWRMAPESAARVGHPAPFPVELPLRLIDLLTYEDDLVLDPFLGSGTTAVAAVLRGRRATGCDTDPAYVELARTRVAEAEAARPDEVAALAVEAGGGIGRIAAEALVAAGWSVEAEGARLKGAGVVADLVAGAPDGRRVPVLVVGGFTVAAGGLARTEEAFGAIGRAAAAVAAGHPAPLLLTSHLPAPKAAAAQALAAAQRAGTIAGVVALLRPTTPADLAALAARP